MKNPLLILALIVALVLMLTGRVTAQTFTSLYSFSATNSAGANSDGANPKAGLVLSGNTLYGTAYGGGNAAYGTVFAISTNGMNFDVLHSFTALVTFSYPVPNNPEYTDYGATNGDGCNPSAGLILSGNTLYGTASFGGYLPGYTNGYQAARGTVFGINIVSKSFTSLHNFNGIDGEQPMGRLILSDTNLYGTTFNGSFNAVGTVFAVNTTGTFFTNLYSFDAIDIPGDGALPEAGLVLSGNNLYGTTLEGGINFRGNVFTINISGMAETNLYSFNGVTDGSAPYGGLVLSGNTLYGTTVSTDEGGTYNYGTVFAINTDGTGFTNLYTFSIPVLNTNTGFYTNTDGIFPLATLILSGKTLYGTACQGGAAGDGTIFAINTNGTGFTTLHSFSTGATNNLGIYTNSDGTSPVADLILSANALYGTAENGGLNGNGTVFRLSLGTTSTPSPQLTIIRAATNIIVTWPMTATGFTLESTTNLVSPVWITVSGQFAVTNAISGTLKFYRLSQ